MLKSPGIIFPVAFPPFNTPTPHPVVLCVCLGLPVQLLLVTADSQYRCIHGSFSIVVPGNFDSVSSVARFLHLQIAAFCQTRGWVPGLGSPRSLLEATQRRSSSLSSLSLHTEGDLSPLSDVQDSLSWHGCDFRAAPGSPWAGVELSLCSTRARLTEGAQKPLPGGKALSLTQAAK